MWAENWVKKMSIITCLDMPPVKLSWASLKLSWTLNGFISLARVSTLLLENVMLIHGVRSEGSASQTGGYRYPSNAFSQVEPSISELAVHDAPDVCRAWFCQPSTDICGGEPVIRYNIFKCFKFSIKFMLKIDQPKEKITDETLDPLHNARFYLRGFGIK